MNIQSFFLLKQKSSDGVIDMTKTHLEDRQRRPRHHPDLQEWHSVTTCRDGELFDVFKLAPLEQNLILDRFGWGGSARNQQQKNRVRKVQLTNHEDVMKTS